MTVAAGGRLVVLTHALPSPGVGEGGAGRPRSTPGGLLSALEPVLRKGGGVWVGAPMGSSAGGALRGAPYRAIPVQLAREEVGRYYDGYSNATLWPIFHSFPGRARFDPRDWPVYEQVNRRYAEAALDEAREGDVVWIHDYHLLRAAPLLRRERPGLRLAFFLHVPFPSPDIFRMLPHGEEILRGLLACDLIGFHVESYLRNFLACVEGLPGARIADDLARVHFEGRACGIGTFPIGVDFERWSGLARAAAGVRLRPERVVLDACRLDYTKGIPRRIQAVQRLLEKHPDLREQVVLLQVVVPPPSDDAETRALKREVERLVGDVNGRLGTASWSPVHYLHRALAPEELAGVYREAEVALVTPLRDGMNVVAKEFVACRTGPPGALVLSQLTGAAETMREALLVNPYDVEATADALHRALVMDEAERERRMQALRERERSADVFAWAARFVGAAADAHAPAGPA